jgi:hypothetical protein
MIILITAEVFERIQPLFMIKSLKKKRLVTERTYLSIIKATYDKPIPNIVLNGEKLKILPL